MGGFSETCDDRDNDKELRIPSAVQTGFRPRALLIPILAKKIDFDLDFLARATHKILMWGKEHATNGRSNPGEWLILGSAKQLRKVRNRHRFPDTYSARTLTMSVNQWQREKKGNN